MITNEMLRDYFAAHAPPIPGLQTFPLKTFERMEVVELGNGLRGPRKIVQYESWAQREARWAYEYADAMRTERAK